MEVKNDESKYVIPTLGEGGFKSGWLLIIIPTMGIPSLVGMGANYFTATFISLFGGVVGTTLATFVSASSRSKKQIAIWEHHNYDWYRASFPLHSHSNGRVSCRHCDGSKIHVNHIRQRSFMRSHSCSQCGKALYFSPE